MSGWNDEGPREAPVLLLCPPLAPVALLSELRWALAERLRVVSYDHRGLGAAPSAGAPFTIRDLAGDALALLDQLGVGEVLVYGESLGGMVAAELALARPERVRRLVLASTLARAELPAVGELLSFLPCVLSPGAVLQPCLARKVLSDAFVAQYGREALRIEALAAREPSRRRDVLALLAAAAGHDVEDRLHGLATPTLVLAGSEDELVPMEHQRALAEALPSGTFAVIAGAGHALSLEQPREVAARVLSHMVG